MYTIGDFDWNRVAHNFGIGYGFLSCDPDDEYATIENPFEDELSESQLISLEQDYKFEIYKKPESMSEEVEDVFDDLEFADGEDARELAEKLNKLGVKPIKTVDVPLVFVSNITGLKTISFDCDEGIYCEVSGDTADSGGYNDDGLYSDGREIMLDDIASNHGGDCAVPMESISGTSFSFDEEISIGELIDAGCLKETE